MADTTPTPTPTPISRITLRVEIDWELNDRLNALCTHHGDKSFIIRNAIGKEVRHLEARKEAQTDANKG